MSEFETLEELKVRISAGHTLETLKDLHCQIIDEELNYWLTPGQPLNEAKATQYLYTLHEWRGLSQPKITVVDSPILLQLKLREYITEKYHQTVRELFPNQGETLTYGEKTRVLTDIFSSKIFLGSADTNLDLFINGITKSMNRAKIKKTASGLDERIAGNSSADVVALSKLEFERYRRNRMPVIETLKNFSRNSLTIRIDESIGVGLRAENFYTHIPASVNMYFYQKLGLLPVGDLIDLNRCGIFLASGFEDHWFLCRMPTRIICQRGENIEFHSTTDKAIEFADGTGIYAVKNRFVDPELFEKIVSSQYRKADFLTTKNVEVRAVAYEMLGTEKLMKVLKAKPIDSHTFHHLNGDVETVTLYKTKEMFRELGSQPLAWVRFVCPSTGHNYLIDVEPHHTSAKLAALSTSPLFTSEADYRFTDRA
jgi:hypothetical protein